jgi:hypothetical protein
MVAIYGYPVVEWQRNHLRSSIMSRISERQSLTREEKFVALVHLYTELRLPFDAALDAAEADLLAEQNKGPKKTARRGPNSAGTDFRPNKTRSCVVQSS